MGPASITSLAPFERFCRGFFKLRLLNTVKLAGLLFVSVLFLSACNMTMGSLGTTMPQSTLPPQESPADEADETDLAAAALDVPPAHAFMGQTSAMLTEHFGASELTRSEGGATIYQFKTNSRRGPCVLLAILYEDRGDEPRIRHMRVREDGSQATEPAYCLSRIAYAHKNARVS